MTTHVSLSGGMDSTAALHRTIRHTQDPVTAVSFDYGQRHRTELDAAVAIADHYGVPHRVLDLTGLLHGSALLGQGEIPHGHYAADTMTATVVNGRNLLFAAALIGVTQPGDTIVLGVHAGDHPVYPDCRPEFIDGLTLCARAYGVKVATPWLHSSKADIVTSEPQTAFTLSWSCYEGGTRHCGRCGTCVERAEAFHLAGVPDPTDYADPDYWQVAAR